mgnify:CR=1 FL=1
MLAPATNRTIQTPKANPKATSLFGKPKPTEKSKTVSPTSLSKLLLKAVEMEKKPTIQEVDHHEESSPAKPIPLKKEEEAQKQIKIIEETKVVQIQPKHTTSSSAEPEVVINDPIEFLKTYKGDREDKYYLQSLKEGLYKIDQIKRMNEELLQQLLEKVYFYFFEKMTFQ